MFTVCLFVNIAMTWCYTIEPVKVRHIEVQAVQVHYDRVVERATEMITRYEGLSLTAYKDTRGYSIGYGTRSYDGEVITKNEAWNRMARIVSDSVHRIRKDFPDANENQLVALTSLYYNCWSGWLHVKKVGFSAWDNPKFCTKVGYSGLEKRRNEERILIWFYGE